MCLRRYTPPPFVEELMEEHHHEEVFPKSIRISLLKLTF